MKKLRKFLKYCLYTAVLVVTLVIILILFIDPIAKYAIQKYDTQYLGREISLKSIHINVIRASVEIDDFKLYEKNGKTPFVSWSRFYTQTDYNPLFNHKLHLYPIQFENLFVNIVTKNGKLNFDDIIKKLTEPGKNAEPKKQDDTSKPFEIDLHQLQITRGLFSYRDADKDVRFWLSDYVLTVPKYNSLNDSIQLILLSKVNKESTLGLNLNYHLKNEFYKAAVNLQHFPMEYLNPYLKDFLRFNTLTSYLNFKSFVQGNLKDASNFSIHGDVKLNDLHFVDAYGQKLSSFKELDVNIDTLNMGSNIYKINAITLKDPYFLFEMYANGNNINRLYQQISTATTTADAANTTQEASSKGGGNVFVYVYDYFKQISKDLILNTYSANKLEIINGNIIYHDFLVGEKMSIETTHLNIGTSRISSSSDSVSAYLTSVLNDVGKLNVSYTADAKTFKDMIVNIGINQFPLTTFNPYSKYYTGFPFKKGDLSINSSIKISDNKLDSKSGLLLEKTKTGSKQKQLRQYNIPLKLLLAILRDKKGNVDIAMPVKGNLNDPNYRLGPVILKILKNLMVKTLAAPANLITGSLSKKDNSEIEIEDNYLDENLSDKLKKALTNTNTFLTETPDLIAELNYYTDTVKEKELLAIQEIKKLYAYTELKLDSSITGNNLDKNVKLTDSLFIRFIDKQTDGRLKSETSLIDKAVSIIGKEKLNNRYHLQKQHKEKQLYDFIDTDLKDIKTRLKINPLSVDKNLLNPKYVITLDALE